MNRNIYKIGNQKYDEDERVKAFWSKVQKQKGDKCWPWLAGPKTGYGQFWTGLRSVHAHRYMLELMLNRKLKTEEHALHSCDNPRCVNPKHIFLGTNIENIQDKVKKNRHKGWSHPNSPKGENHPKAKLSNTDVTKIRRRINEGEILTRIAEDYKVTIQTISFIKRKITWKSV